MEGLEFKLLPTLDVGAFNLMINTMKQSLGRFGADIKPIDEKAYQDNLKKFESETKKSFKKVGDDSKKAGTDVSTGLGGGFDKATEATKSFSNSLGGLKSRIADVASGQLIATGITKVFSSVISSYKDFIALSNQQEQAERKVEQAIRSTGGAAGFSAEELKKMASAYQEITTFGDEVILDGQGMLLTFTNIGRDVFPKATEAMLNMSAAMGTDLQSTAIQLGKALNNPIEGLSALSRAGVQFSDEQKKLIRTFVETGQTAEAQKVMLAELEIQFGGLATAMADTDAGQMQQLSNTFGDLKEKVGDAIKTVLVAFRPAMESLINVGERIIPVLRASANAFASLSPILIPVAGAFAVVTASAIAFNQAANFARMATDAAQYGLSIVKTVVPALITQNATTGALALNMNALSIATIRKSAAEKASLVFSNLKNFANRLLFKSTNELTLAEIKNLATNKISNTVSGVKSAVQTTLANTTRRLSLATIQESIATKIGTVAASGYLFVKSAIAKAQAMFTIATIKQTALNIKAAVSTGLVASAQWMLNAALNANPIGIVILAVGALVGAIVLLYKHSESVRNVINGLGSVLSAVFSGFLEIGKSVLGIFVSVGQVLFQFFIAPLQIAWGVLSAFGELLFGSAEAGINFEAILQNVGKAITWITDRLEIVQIGIKAFSAVVKSVIDSVVKTITSILTLDFSGFIDNIRNSGKNAGEAFGNAFEDEVENRKFDKVKDELVTALNSAAQEGNLTNELVQELADKYGVAVERIHELADTNENIKETIKQTNALKDGSIGFSVKLNLIQEQFNEAVEREKTLRLQLDALRKTGTAEQIAAKEAEIAVQRQGNTELYKEVESLKKLEDEINSQYQKKTAQSKQQTAEKKSQYEIAVADFELTKKAAEFNQKLDEVEFALAQRRSGVISNERDLALQKLAQSKQQTREINNQYQSALNLFDIAKKQFDTESARGKVSTNTQKEMQDAQNRLNDYILQLRSAELSELELEVKLNADDEALRREVNRIKTEINLAEIQYNIKLGIASDKDLLIAEMDIIENRMAELMTNLADASLTADIVNEMKLEYTNLQSELFDKQNELREKNRLAQINEITNLAMRERELRIFESEKVYAEELQLAGENSALRLQAHIKLQTAKLKAEQDYLAESSRINTIAASAIAEFNIALLAGGSSNDLAKQRTDRRARLREEEDELLSSFGRREISREEYLKRSNKLENDYRDLQNNSGLAIANQIASTFANAFSKASQKFLDDAAPLLKKAQDEREQYNEAIKKYDEELLLIGDQTNERYKQILEERNIALAGAQAEQDKIYNLMFGQFVANLGSTLAEGEKFDKAILRSTFMMLESLIPIFAAKILGYSLATYDSVMSFGATGFARAALITGGLYAALAVAKSAAGFRKGGYTGDGHLDEVAGVVHRKEYVVNELGTRNKENQMFFDWTNRTGGSVVEFVKQQYDISQLVKGYRFEKEQVKFLIENDIIQLPTNDNKELVSEIKLLRNEVQELREIKRLIEEGNYSRHTRQAVDVDVRFSENSIVEKVNLNKYAQLKRM